MVSQNIEEYLEAIYILEFEREALGAKTGEIAKMLKIAPPSVTEVISKLEEEGFLSYKKYYGVNLTREGKRIAEKVVRKHRLAERLLVDVLNIEREEIEEVACGFEHAINENVEEEICKLLKHPRICPHGNPIPKGKCCEKD